MGPMVSSFDSYSMTELLYNVRFLLFVGDILLIAITVMTALLVYKLFKNKKEPK